LLKNEKLERDIFWKFGKQTALRSGDWKIVNGIELYNLKEDRFEKYNVSEKYPEKLSELRKRYADIETKTKPSN